MAYLTGLFFYADNKFLILVVHTFVLTRCLLQLAPLDCPLAVDAFLAYWKPLAVLLMESELWPNLIISATEKGVSDPFVIFLNVYINTRSGSWTVLKFFSFCLKVLFSLCMSSFKENKEVKRMKLEGGEWFLSLN